MTASAKAPEQVPEAVTELETSENENEQFNNSFVNPVKEYVRSRLSEATPMSLQIGKSQAIIDDWKLEEATK
jgi:hypothetical protein